MCVDLNTLKQLIVKLIKKQKISKSELILFQQDPNNNQEQILKILSFYIKFSVLENIDDLNHFINLTEELLDVSFVENSNLDDRSFRVFLRRKMDNFTFIDWDNEENLKELLEYFYIRANFDKNIYQKEQEVLKYKSNKEQEVLKSKEKNVNSKMNIFNVPLEISKYDKNPMCTRKEAFTLRNKPTLSMDNYIKLIEANQKMLLKANETVITKNLLEKENTDDTKDIQLEELDEIREDNRKFRGNLYKQG